MTPPHRAVLAVAGGLLLTVAAASQGGTNELSDVGARRRGLRHGELVAALEQQLAAAPDPRKPALARVLALVKVEAELLARLGDLATLPGRPLAGVLAALVGLEKSPHEEVTLARLAFLLGDVATGEAALGRARDRDPELKGTTDTVLAEARGQRLPRGGYFRYRGAWLALADRDHARALDEALAALAAVAVPGVRPPVVPSTERSNRPAFERLGAGVGVAALRTAAVAIAASLEADYTVVRSWLPSYAAQKRLRKRLLDQREALRVVQREAIALIQHYTKLEQPRVDDYRQRLRAMHDEFQRDVQRDFGSLRRLDPAKAWDLHQRLRRREGALEAIDRFLVVAGVERLAAGVVRPAPGSTVTTVHLLPGRRTSGLEDTLWLLLKFKCEQYLDVFARCAEILRQAPRLTPWERLVLEIVQADAVDAYNARVAISLDAVEVEFVAILNAYRRTLGLRPFELEERLNVSANKHSQEMVDLGYFGHVSPIARNRTPSDRARLEGYNGGVGENCLSGSGNARGAFEGWYHSPGHHRNLISGGPHLGVGRAAVTMWTMVAGGTDWSWRNLHRDLPPPESRRLARVVKDFVDLRVKTGGKPDQRTAGQLRSLRAALAAGLPDILPYVARVAFAAARERRHPAHGAFPELLELLVGADLPKGWRPLQVAAVAAAIDAVRFSDRLELRQQAWALVRPLLHREFTIDWTARGDRLVEFLAAVRKQWEDVGQWRFRAAPDAGPPAVPRVVGRVGDGPSLNAARRMLTRRERLRMAKKFGGSSRTEQAVELGLAFLASVQDADGGWRAKSFPLQLPKVKGPAGGGTAEWEIAMTGLALLSFSSAGYTTESGEYAEVVARGARFLASKLVDYGRFETAASHYMYNHALGTQALCEVYSYSADPHLGVAAQLAVDYLVYAQHQGTGGWRYEANQPGDTSVSGWVIMALNSAFKAELDVSGFRSAMRFLDRVTQSPYYQVGYVDPFDAATQGNRLTAVAMTGRLFLGAKHNDSRLVLPAYRLMEDLPAAHRIDFYYWYYATLALFQLGEPFFDRWNKALVPVLLAEQDTSSRNGLRGSWSPRGQWSNHGGRIYQTSLAVLMLTTYYRYERSPKVRLHPFTGDIDEAIRPLLEAIRDDRDARRQRIAMRKLVDTFGASLVGPVVRVVQDGKADIGYRRRLASLLAEVVERRHAGMVAGLLGVDDQDIAMSAIHAFVECSSRASVPTLLQQLGNRHRLVRGFCAQQLGRLGDPAAVTGINQRLAAEPDPWVKGELQKALQLLARRSRLVELLAAALPADAEGYLGILDGLAPVERDGLVDPVFALRASAPKLFGEALQAIRRYRRAAAVPLLLVLMDSPALDARARAMRLVRGITRKNFGFDPKAGVRSRRTVLQSWRRWFETAAPGFGEPR